MIQEDLRTVVLFLQKDDLILVERGTIPGERVKSWFIKINNLIQRQLTQAGVFPSDSFNVEIHIPESTKEHLFGMVTFMEQDTPNGTKWVLQGSGVLERLHTESEQLRYIRTILQDYNEFRITDEVTLQKIRNIFIK